MRKLGIDRGRIQRLTTEVLTVVLGQGFGALGLVVGIRLVTEFTSRPVYGDAKLLSGLALLTVDLVFTPFCSFAMRQFPQAATADQLHCFAAFTRKSILKIYAATAIPFGVATALYLRPTSAPEVLAWALTLALLGLWGLVSIERALLVAARRQGRMSVIRVTENWGSALGIAVGVWLLGDAVWAYLTGWVVFYVVGLGLYYTLVAPRHSVSPREASPAEIVEWRRSAWTFGAPLILMGLLGWTLGNGSRYIVDLKVGSEGVGLFVACFGLASAPFTLAARMIAQFFRPIWYHAEEQGNRRRIRQLMLAYIGAAIAVSSAGLATLFVFGEPLIGLALAEPYRVGALPILLWVSAGYSMLSVAGAFEMALHAEKRTGLTTVAYVIAVALNLTLAWTLTQSAGAVGAAQATCYSLVVYAVLLSVFWLGRRRLR